MRSTARTSRPRPAISAPGARRPWPALDRQALHAYLLALEHPKPGRFWSGTRICLKTSPSCGIACERRYDAGVSKKLSYDNRLWQPHGDVTADILPKPPRFGVCCTCVEYPTRNIAERLALTQRPSAWPAAIGGLNHWRALNGPCSYPADSQWRIRPIPLPRRDPQVSDAGTPAGIHARQALARARRSRRGPSTRHQPSPARGQDSHGLSRLRIADFRGRLGRQCRPDAGGEAVRAREGLPACHLRHVVDQGVNTRVHPAFLVAREDGHHREPEEAVLQPAQGQEQDLRAGRG